MILINIAGIVFYSASLIICISAIFVVLSENEDTRDLWMKWLIRASKVVIISYITPLVYAIYMMVTGSFWMK